MKHLLNNMTESEKNAIREQHTGGMKAMTENFNKFVNSKSGDVKPLVKEQQMTNEFFFDTEDESEDMGRELPMIAPNKKPTDGPFGYNRPKGDWYDSNDERVYEPIDFSDEKEFGPEDYDSFMEYINGCNTKWCLTTKRMYDAYANVGSIKIRK